MLTGWIKSSSFVLLLVFSSYRSAEADSSKSITQMLGRAPQRGDKVCIGETYPTSVPVFQSDSSNGGWSFNQPGDSVEYQRAGWSDWFIDLYSDWQANWTSPEAYQEDLLCKVFIKSTGARAFYGVRSGSSISCTSEIRHSGHPPCDR